MNCNCTTCRLKRRAARWKLLAKELKRSRDQRRIQLNGMTDFAHKKMLEADQACADLAACRFDVQARDGLILILQEELERLRREHVATLKGLHLQFDCDERAAACAREARLREALRKIADDPYQGYPYCDIARAALREVESAPTGAHDPRCTTVNPPSSYACPECLAKMRAAAPGDDDKGGVK